MPLSLQKTQRQGGRNGRRADPNRSKGQVPGLRRRIRSDAPKAVRNPRILNLIKKARTSAQGDPLIDWLKPFMVQRKYRKDDVVFQRGDVTNELFWIESGKFLVGGTLIEIQAGRFFGELGISRREISGRRPSNARKTGTSAPSPMKSCSSFFWIRSFPTPLSDFCLAQNS